MDPESVRRVGRVPHGGETDRTLVDCSANTNPRTPSGVEDVYADALETARRYPDDGYPEFRAAAAEFVGVDPSAVIPTSGGLAAIRLAIGVSVDAGDEVLVPAPSFSEYAREVRLQGATPRFVSHDAILGAGVDSLEDCALAVVCTPNNPTGEAAAPDDLAAFAERCADAGTRLLVDEAFLGFTDRPSAAALDREHVIVARSLTKLFGLPGLRAGYAVATGAVSEDLETARRAWSLGTPAAAVGAYCLRRGAFVDETRRRVARERERLREALERRFDALPSDAPFLCLDVGERDVDAVVATARERGVAIRDATTFRGLDSHVRVAIKDSATTDAVLAALGVDDGARTDAENGPRGGRRRPEGDES